MRMPAVRVSVHLTAEEHEGLIRKYPGEAIGSILRRIAAADIGIETRVKKARATPPAAPEFREIAGEQVRVPPWWKLVEALERAAGGHFFVGDVRDWPASAFARWATLAKQYPEQAQWEKLGVYLRANPPRNTLSFRFGMSSWCNEQMQFALAAQSSVVASRLVLLEQASKGRFASGQPPGPKTRRLANRAEADWTLLGEWLAAGGFNWMWEKMGQRQAGVEHIEKWGDEMFARAASWAASSKPTLPAPKLNGLSAERAQDESAYQQVDAKSLLRSKQ